MKIYLAGLYANSFYNTGPLYRNKLNEKEQEIHNQIAPYILESYHYIGKGRSMSAKIRNTHRQVFLDSGAFSAFTKGVTVSIDDYVAFIKDNEDIIVRDGNALCASVLDAIGDCNATYANQIAMQQRGVTPLPCFHYGEPEEALEYYLTHYEYITLGGMVPISSPQLKLWLDRIWDKIITDKDGKPRCKVHGFGLTTLSLMERYPWYSVDSSSWVQVGSVGNIYYKGTTLAISEHSPSRKVRGRHYDSLPEMQRECIRSYVESKGFSIERLRVNYCARWLYNCLYFKELNEHITKDKPEIFRASNPGLF